MAKSPRDAHRSSREAGFVLLTALWLLLLGGVMAAAVMATGLSAAREARAYEEHLRARLAAEAAIETVAYDLLTHGAASRWGAGGSGSVSVTEGTSPVMVEVAHESGRLDLGRAAIEDIERLLGVLDIEADERRRALGALKAHRAATGERRAAFRALAEVFGTLGATPSAWRALAPHVTVYTGASRPSARYAAPELRRALELEAASGAGDLESRMVIGEVFRIRATVTTRTQRLTKTRIVRPVGAGERPLWWYASVE